MELLQTSFHDYDFDCDDPRPKEKELTVLDIDDAFETVYRICRELAQIDANEWALEDDAVHTYELDHDGQTNTIDFLVDGPGFETAKEVGEILCRNTGNLPSLPEPLEAPMETLLWPFQVMDDSYREDYNCPIGHLMGSIIHFTMEVQYPLTGDLYVNLMSTPQVPIYFGPLDEDAVPLIRSAMRAYAEGDYHLVENEYEFDSVIPKPREFIVPKP